MPKHGRGTKGNCMSEKEMTGPDVDRRRGAAQRSESDRRLWVRRELANRRYGKGRRVWNRRHSAVDAVEQEARTGTRRAGVRRRIGDERRDESTRRHTSERRSADRRVA